MSVVMATKEINISSSELARLEIYCPSCVDVAIMVDVLKTDGFGRIENCPVCNKPLSMQLRDAITAYSRFQRAVSESKSKIQFRVRIDD